MTDLSESPTASPAPDGRPGLVILTNVLTPYRVALHQRIVRELPGLRLWTILTHDIADQPWALQGGDIGVVKFVEGGEDVMNAKPILRGRRDWAKGGRIIDFMKAHHVRAVLVSGYFDLTRVRLIRWGHAAGVPAFLVSDSNARGDRATGVRRTVKNTIIRSLVKWCAGIMPCGSLGAEYFVERGADRARIFYFPYEPDYALIRQMPPARIAEVAAKYQLREGRRRMVVCARMIAVKRIDLAIDGLAAIARERPDWDLVIIGSGPLKEQLQARVPTEIRDRVLWLGFIGDQSEISAIYRASDVLLCVSDYEPWGLVINEGVCAGMAIVSTNVVGASAELVRDGVNGRVFPPGDLAAYTRALLEVTDPARIGALKAASPGVLEDWRRRGDPVDGLRAALASAGVTADGRSPS